MGLRTENAQGCSKIANAICRKVICLYCGYDGGRREREQDWNKEALSPRTVTDGKCSLPSITPGSHCVDFPAMVLVSNADVRSCITALSLVP